MQEQENYADGQFTKYAPLPLHTYHNIRLQLRTTAGCTNWLNIDEFAAHEIEEAIRNSYKRKDADAAREKAQGGGI